MTGFGHDAHLLTYWWTALALSAAAVLLGAARLSVWRHSSRFSGAVKAAVLIVLAALFVEDVTSEWSTPAERLQRLGLQLGLAGAVWLVVRHLNQRRQTWRAHVLGVVLLAGGLASLCWHAGRGQDHPGFNAPLDLRVGSAELAAERFDEEVVQTGPPDAQVNCHGWTFAGGERSLDADDVSRILDEQSWRPVEDPAAGDVVIYHDDEGDILHSGRVKSRKRDGAILVESKWGALGRFIHPVEVQAFPSRHTYYQRASRRMAE